MSEDPTGPEHQEILDDTRQLADDARHLYDTLQEDNPLAHYYDRNPYAVLGAAAGVGYILGGGLMTPFTRRLLRVGLKAMAVPVAASQLRQLAQGAAGDDISIGQSDRPADDH